jgi:hypothetical protein
MAKKSTGDYSVGYCRPPSHTRFAPGVSGNPRGRPRGNKNLKTDVLEEIREKVSVREGEKSRSISKQRAIVKTVVMRALKGDGKAINTLVALLLRFQETAPDVEAPNELATEDRAILDRFLARATTDRPAATPPAKGHVRVRRRVRPPSSAKGR